MRALKNAFFFTCSGFLSLLLLLSVSGCSNGGGDDPSQSGPKVGSVTVLITDGPSVEVDRFIVEVTRVSLIPEGDGDPVVVFKGKRRIDVMEFRDRYFILTADDEVPAGRYEKIRLELSDVEIVPETLCDEIKVPSWKIDLNPRGTFEVSPEAAIFVSLDVQAQKSIHFHEAGKKGKCIFRPVVFVDIETEKLEKECPQEIAGTILEIKTEDLDDDRDDGDRDGDKDYDNEDGPDEDKHFHSDFDDLDDEIAELRIGLGEDGGEIWVEVFSDTAIFDAQAFAADFSTLEVGDPVLIRGLLEQDSDLEAIWIIQGEPRDIKGTFETAIADGKFTFQVDSDSLDGRVTEGTLAYPECIVQLVDLGDIVPGQKARIIGVMDEEEGNPFIRAAVIDLGPIRVGGEIAALNGDSSAITLRLEDDSEITFSYDEFTEIALVGDGSLIPEDLVVGQNIIAYLNVTKDYASKIEIQPEEAEGLVDDFDPDDRTFLLLPEDPPPPETPIPEVLVSVAPNATVILMVGDDDLSQVDLGELKDGDKVELFGLIPEPGIFDARTVIIRR